MERTKTFIWAIAYKGEDDEIVKKLLVSSEFKKVYEYIMENNLSEKLTDISGIDEAIIL